MPSLSDNISFYGLGLLIALSCVLLSFPSDCLEASAALLMLWGGFGVLRFNALSKAASNHEFETAQSQPLPQKILNTFRQKKQKDGYESIRFFFSSGSLWVAGVLVLGLVTAVCFYLFGEDRSFRTDWPDLVRGLSLLCACTLCALSFFSFLKQPTQKLKLMVFWSLIWSAAALIFNLKLLTDEALHLLIFTFCAVAAGWRAYRFNKIEPYR